MAAKNDANTLVNSLVVNDDLAAVLRSHLLVEQLIEEFIFSKLEVPGELEDNRLSFEVKVSLALALGLTQDLRLPLRQLNKIRNSFAHSSDAVLEERLVDCLFRSFTNSTRKTIQSWLNGQKSPTNKDKFAYSVIMLHTTIENIVHPTQEKPADSNK